MRVRGRLAQPRCERNGEPCRCVHRDGDGDEIGPRSPIQQVSRLFDREVDAANAVARAAKRRLRLGEVAAEEVGEESLRSSRAHHFFWGA